MISTSHAISRHPELSALALGATLYMPATRADLWHVASGHKYARLRSLVICLEDAINEQDVPLGLQHLQELLQRIAQSPRLPHAPLLFVRPRHPRMAAQLAEWPLIHQLDGMVLPKFDLDSLPAWLRSIPSEMLYLPTLETASVFDAGAMRELREAMTEQFPRVLALRIGGNDLLSCLGLRRPPQHTIYQTPVGAAIGMLAGLFIPHGFALSGPVCEYFADPELLIRELQLDLQHGLSGKTIIHPVQIETVHRCLWVLPADLAAAEAILDLDAQAVFNQNGAMLEPATHRRWAERIRLRARLYGTGEPDQDNDVIDWPKGVRL